MAEFWEEAFREKQMMWGLEPAASASAASDHFARCGVKRVLIPGVGYGRNARPFLARGMAVTGIEISGTAIALARAQSDLALEIHHGSVEDMPYDRAEYDGVFCHGLLYLFDAERRGKLLSDCYRQLAPGGWMMFSLVSKTAPMYGKGARLGDDWYEIMPGVKMYFYDAGAVAREFGPFGMVELSEIEEPGHGSSLPFLLVTCRRQ